MMKEKDEGKKIEDEMKLIDLVYRYGGKEAIQLNGSSTLPSILTAYEELKKNEGRKREKIVPPPHPFYFATQ